MPELDLGNVKGPQGKSAYQSALDAGYSGSEEAFNTAMAKAPDAVLYTAQSLSDAQKTQARTNINAAPGGFGLGTAIVGGVSGGRDANNLSGCGFFRADQNTPTSDWWYGYQIEYSAGYKYQRCVKSASFEIVERKQINNVWGAWEYVNPPMALGVEYRTTERYLGKPVYVKAVDCGAVPSNTQKIISMGVSGFITKIRCDAFATNSADVFTIPRKVNDTEVTVTLASSANNIYISSNTDTLENYNVYTIMYYTKGMD